MEYTWILWDIAAAAVLFRCVRVCAYRGLLRTLVGFFSYFIATVVARLVSVPLAGMLYDNVVRDLLETVLAGRMEEAFQEGTGLLEAIPAVLRVLAGGALETEAGFAPDSAGVAGQVIDLFLEEPVLLLLQGISFFFVFSMSLYFLRYLARMFTGVNRIPLVGTANAFLGGMVGVLQGGVTLLVGVYLLNLVILVSGNSLWWLNTGVMDSTYVWHFFWSAAGLNA